MTSSHSGRAASTAGGGISAGGASETSDGGAVTAIGVKGAETAIGVGGFTDTEVGDVTAIGAGAVAPTHTGDAPVSTVSGGATVIAERSFSGAGTTMADVGIAMAVSRSSRGDLVTSTRASTIDSSCRITASA